MSQRASGYALQPNETYITPDWVWDTLYAEEDWASLAFDCAPPDADFDFLDRDYIPPSDWIATNPPFSLAEKFIRKALKVADKVAMLLPNNFDTAIGRKDLFLQPPFKIKYVLTRRIRWKNLPQKKNGPTSNHAWFVWDYEHLTMEPRIWWI